MQLDITNEIERLRAIYKSRDHSLYSTSWKESIYHVRHPMGRLFFEHSFNILVDALNTVDIPLEHSRVLDVGCGVGGWLRLLVEMGASPENLTGTDLSASRIETARKKNPAINWVQAQGDCLTFETGQFELVTQVVVFSSITNVNLAKRLLCEMRRVTKPGGYIVWIDHKRSHSASLTGYSLAELTNYLSGCSLVYRQSVHPRYFRYVYHYPSLCRFIYRFSKIQCDSWLFIFKKGI